MGTVTDIGEDFVEAMVLLDPVRASRGMGLARDSTELTDYSPEGWAAIGSLLRQTLAALRQASPVDEPERLGKAFLEDDCEGELALLDAGESQRLLSAVFGPPAMVRMCFDVMPAEGDDDWERIGARLRAVPAAMEGYRVSLDESASRGEVPATRLVTEVARQCDTWGRGWFEGFVAGYGDGGLRSDLDEAAASASTAYRRLAEWLQQDLAPRATERDGVGRDRYRVWARAVLGADRDPDESYDWGVEELARLEQEQARECERILPGASFDEVRHHLETDPAGVVEGADQYRDALQGIVDEAIESLAGVEFEIAPALMRCLVVIPPAGSALAPYYSPPSEDLSQPGTTWFPTGDRDRFPMWDEVTTCYHEAVPGHHLQLGALRVLPLMRAHRLGFQVAHGEGWALYAERLMDELGWFRTPATRLGFLSSQAFRAARVVVDIGLHTGRDGWTYERAVEALEHHGGLTRPFAESEVARYLSYPAQATAYKLGERAWLAGREAAVRHSERAFDRKAWHSRALGLGPLGLDHLERELSGIVGTEG